MTVKRKKVDNHVERLLITGMIVSTRFLKEVTTIYDAKLMEIPFAKTVADWCLRYYEQYEKAPKKHIQDIYHSASRKGMDEDQSEMIGDFLESISGEYEHSQKFNVQYVLDLVEQRFRAKSLEHLSEDIQALASRGEVLKAEARLGEYKRVERPQGGGINPFTNTEVIFNAFENNSEPLFTFPGALGSLLNDHLVREGFIGIMGKEKIGKTWELMEFAIQASKARCNVAIFEVGDMSESQIVVRTHIRLAGKSNNKKYCGKVYVPVLDCVRNQEDSCTSRHRCSHCGIGGSLKKVLGTLFKENEPVDIGALLHSVPDTYKPCSYCLKARPHKFRGSHWFEERFIEHPLTWREAVKNGSSFMSRMRGRDFKIATYPSDTASPSTINAQLDIWEREGFVPDVIIIDYADILAPEPRDANKEFRHQQNGIWKSLRKMSQQRRALIIVATQVASTAYESDCLKLKHFSEDKRKYAHVTGMLTLNQSEKEKVLGIMRIGWLLLREGSFDPSFYVKVIRCLNIGRPHIASYV